MLDDPVLQLPAIASLQGVFIQPHSYQLHYTHPHVKVFRTSLMVVRLLPLWLKPTHLHSSRLVLSYHSSVKILRIAAVQVQSIAAENVQQQAQKAALSTQTDCKHGAPKVQRTAAQRNACNKANWTSC